MLQSQYLGQVCHILPTKQIQRLTQKQIAPRDKIVAVQIILVTRIAPIVSPSPIDEITTIKQLISLINRLFKKIIMGNICIAEGTKQDFGVFNPIQLQFKRVQPVILPPNINNSLNSISTMIGISEQIVDYPDPRQNIGLKWYYCKAYDLYLYGDIQNKKPSGECLFYIKKKLNESSQIPTIIATKIQQKNGYHSNTLLLYSDGTFYLGTISTNGNQPPIAQGRGMLVSKKFIYQGDFKNGYPNGYGTFKTKAGILVGEFVNGEPQGQCVERNKKGLFIGQLLGNQKKTGKLITPHNQATFIDQQTTSKEKTIVQL